MQEQVVTVDPNGPDTQNAPQGDADEQPADRPPVKFLHPGGSRPLDGYTIKRGIGQGGFGEIYFALSDAGKEVALKLIRRNLEIELRGIRHCLNLKHPNLLALYDLRQDGDGDSWVVMEYASGGCLEGTLRQHPHGMPVEEALRWFGGIAAGVAYLHDRGIVHRDLKPGNIFSDEGLVKVGDYGLSKFISCSRRSGQTESVGTVHYMAPEVANGRYGKEIDIYALGIMLYEMLTGTVPFEGESVGEVLMKHLTAQPDLSVLQEPYRTVVGRALEKDPEKRYRTVEEMVAALPMVPQIPGTGSVPGSYVGAGDTVAAVAAPVHAEVVDEEPILRACVQSCSKVRTAWLEANLATPIKVLILMVALFALLRSSRMLIPVAVMMLMFYGVYRFFRMLLVSTQRPHHAAGQRHAGTTSPAVPQRKNPALARTLPAHRGKRRRHAPVEALVYKSPRDRFTELVGSLLVGSLVAVAMCVVTVLLKSYHTATPPPEQCAWLVLISIAGTWAILIPSKFWEGTRGEPTLRRFVMMVIGLGIGLFAFGVAEMLLVKLPHTPASFPTNYRLPGSFYGEDAQPLAMAYMACFATLFLVLRWWRQADPLRASRLSVWSMIVSVAFAGLVAAAWHFPQPWLPMIAGTVSASVQLASPWVHPSKRGSAVAS